MTRGTGAAHDRRRAELIDAALAVAARTGVAGVSQAAVASAASVSPGRVQHYFPTMTALLAAALDHLGAASSARIRELVGAELDVAPPRDVLETVLTELLPHDEPSRAHLQFRQSFTALALHHADVAARLRERYHRLHHVDLADLVRRDQHGGRIDPDVDPVAAATSLAALAEGLAYYVLIDALAPDAARDQVLGAVEALYARAHLPEPEPTSPHTDRAAGARS